MLESNDQNLFRMVDSVLEALITEDAKGITYKALLETMVMHGKFNTQPHL